MPFPTHCTVHPSQPLHWVGFTTSALRCKLCSTTATREWRHSHPWKRMWQSLVQRARRKYNRIAADSGIDLSWRITGHPTVLRCLNRMIGRKFASLDAAERRVGRSRMEALSRSCILTWKPFDSSAVVSHYSACSSAAEGDHGRRFDLDHIVMIPSTRAKHRPSTLHRQQLLSSPTTQHSGWVQEPHAGIHCRGIIS